ncbi:MAG TPA: hypothetical protein VNO26_10815 [Candidatus Limnocylindria bacterium]|nr:hypothetical protein [Candidatus Limnocylindria bacterium]
MRFVVTAEWRENHLLRLILACFLVFVALLWVTNALLFFTQMSLAPSSIVAFYHGSEATFAQPRSFKVLLEISHFHLFAMGILVLTMTHLVLFVPIGIRTKVWLVVVSFTGALADEAGGWLVRFVHPLFAWVKLGGFVAVQGSLAVMIALVAWAVWKTPPNAYRGG